MGRQENCGMPNNQSYTPAGETEATDDRPLPPDAYSVLLIRLTQWWDTEPVPVWGLFHGLLVYALAVFLQVSITANLAVLCEEQESQIESIYFQKHFDMTLHEAGNRIWEAVETGNSDFDGARSPDGGLLTRCNPELGVEYWMFYFIMVIVWLIKMTPEFQEVGSIIHNIWSVEDVKQESAGCYDECFGKPKIFERRTLEEGKNEELKIVGLHTWMKVVLIILVPGMKFFVTSLITYNGAKFIITQHKTMTIVLKALAMLFVVQLDEFVATSMATRNTKAILTNVRLSRRKHNTPGTKHP